MLRTLYTHFVTISEVSSISGLKLREPEAIRKINITELTKKKKKLNPGGVTPYKIKVIHSAMNT